jgi:hypothetical protein
MRYGVVFLENGLLVLPRKLLRGFMSTERTQLNLNASVSVKYIVCHFHRVLFIHVFKNSVMSSTQVG